MPIRLGIQMFVIAVLILLTAIAPSAEAQAAVKGPFRVDIPTLPLGEALKKLADQGDLQIVFTAESVRALRAPRITGLMNAEQALEALLTGTELESVPVGDAYVIRPRRRAAPSRDASTTSQTGGAAEAGAGAAGIPSKSFWNRFRMAQVDQGSSSGQVEAKDSAHPVELEEVLVTATKRQESVLDVPISITVISAQDIERRGPIGMEDYLRAVPGVSQIDRGGVDNTIVIRGITTTPESENLSSGTTVATYFDETPITGAGGMGAGGIDVRPVDIERIEILRGPQGTTYGSSSLSGALRIIPAKPRLDAFSAKFRGNYSATSGTGGDNTMIQGTINVPLITDTLAVRAVGYRYDDSGYIENIAGIDPATLARATTFGLGSYVGGFVREDMGRIESTGGRVAALWRPADAVDLSLSFLTQKIEQDGAPLAEIGKYQQTDIPTAPLARLRGQSESIADTEIDLANLVLNYDTGRGTLTTAVSWIDSGSESAVEAALALPSTASPISHFKSLTGETRFASQFDGPLQFLAGLFYEHVKEDLTNSLFWPGTSPPPFGTNPLLRTETRRHRDQRAVFGEVSYGFTDQLTATVGGRYFRYDKAESQLREGGLVSVPLGSAVPGDLDSDEGDTTYKANLSYKPGASSLLYASWSQGFRLGYPTAGLSPALCDSDNDGIVDGTGISIESTRRVNSDFLDNYELGAKLALLERRLVLDASVYHIEWDGLPIATGVGCSPLGYTANAGAATSRGIEIQASLSPMESLRIDIGAGYTDAELARDAPLLPGAPQDGARLPGSPRVNANLGAQYTFPVAGYTAFIRADSMYVGKFYADLLESPGAASGDYVKVDARAGVAFGKLSTELFVRNLTNEDAFTWRRVNSATNPFFGYRLRPRTIGIQLGYTFE